VSNRFTPKKRIGWRHRSFGQEEITWNGKFLGGTWKGNSQEILHWEKKAFNLSKETQGGKSG